MKIVFFMGHDGFIRNFEPTIRALADRGHEVHLAVAARRQAIMSHAASIDELCADTPGVTWSRSPKGRDTEHAALAERVYACRNLLRFLEPQYRHAHKLRARAERHAPHDFVRLCRTPALAVPAVRALVDGALRSATARIPVSPELTSFLERHRPDTVLVTPLIGLTSLQTPAVRAARAAGIPSALLVHSWDNLTNKGLIHELPDRVVVWNARQRDEAVELHSVDRRCVVVTGAQSYDQWFERTPSRNREAFCAQVGLDHERPILLYVCSSMFIAPEEMSFVRRWTEHVRSATDERLRNAGILVRPHPQALATWKGRDLSDLGQVALWPAPGSERAGAAAQADYFDSIHHSAAVVGINTSALIESAIVDRPVHTLLAPEFRDTQQGTLHFSHLLSAGGEGLLRVASSWEEHLDQLAAVLAGDDSHHERNRRFLEDFVRPHGLDVAAGPKLVQAVEGLAAVDAGRGDRAYPNPAGAILRGAARGLRRPASPSEVQGQRAQRILFLVRNVEYGRHFEEILRLLLTRGHRIHVAFDHQRGERREDAEVFDRLASEHPLLSSGPLPFSRDGQWDRAAEQLRFAIDYLRYLEPEFASADALRERARRRAPAIVARLVTHRTPAVMRSLLERILREIELAAPPSNAVSRYVERVDPDLVMLSPLVGLGSPQGEYIRVARRLGIPTLWAVASWDNLTNKGVARDRPDLTAVWNRGQVAEATSLHDLSANTVQTVGAHTYDHWFERTPSRDRETFCAQVGLDPRRPILLYLCSSAFIAPEEVTFIERWLQRIRAAPDPALRDAAVLVRPHPMNAGMWRDADLAEPGLTTVWPRSGAQPTAADTKADYFDSIHHSAAVVGINTSALIESAIVDRPVHTLLAPEFRDTQQGTLHFSHLLSAGGEGLLRVASSWEEHLDQLAAVLAGDDSHHERNRRFLEDFVRPHGLDVAAGPKLVQAVEELMSKGVRPQPQRRREALIRLAASPIARWGPQLMEPIGSFGVPRVRRRLRHRRSSEIGLRVLFVLDHPGLLLHFDETVRELAARGHQVRLAFDRVDKFRVGLDQVADHSGRVITQGVTTRRRGDPYRRIAEAIRSGVDFLHYLTPEMSDAVYSRAKWTALNTVPRGLRSLRNRRLSGWQVHALLAVLRHLEAALPSPLNVDRSLEKLEPDVVLVSPLVNRAGYQTDIVKSARGLGLPVALCVASWDNLTSKGRIRVVPDRVIVWNATQVQEATELHGVDRDRIITTGAQPFDRWFDREPAMTREAFCSRLGLDPERPFILFAGTTKQARGPGREVAFVRQWVAALRARDQGSLRSLQVLVRPHPAALEEWEDVGLSDLEDVAVWRRERSLPVRDDDRSEYFDAIYHCAAVMAINSSVMVEAAVVDRPVHTIRVPEFKALQHDLMHYHYLLRENGGFLAEAWTLEEHLDRLAQDLEDPGRDRQMRERFVSSFIRPQGRARPSTPLLVKAIDELAHEPPRTPSRLEPRYWPARLALMALAAKHQAEIVALRTFEARALATRGPLNTATAALQRGGRMRGPAGGVCRRGARSLDRARRLAARTGKRARLALKARGGLPLRAEQRDQLERHRTEQRDKPSALLRSPNGDGAARPIAVEGDGASSPRPRAPAGRGRPGEVVIAGRQRDGTPLP